MKALSILFLIIVISFITACNKDSFTTKPQISVKSINRNVLTRGQDLKIEIEFTDAEGDVQDTIWYSRTSKICATQTGVNILDKLKIPNFESIKNQRGYFDFSYIYGTTQTGFIPINGCSSRNDTSVFKFWMKDKAKNYSDTISTGNIVLLR